MRKSDGAVRPGRSRRATSRVRGSPRRIGTTSPEVRTSSGPSRPNSTGAERTHGPLGVPPGPACKVHDSHVRLSGVDTDGKQGDPVPSRITREALHARITGPDRPVLVEALGAGFYADAHLPGAINIPPGRVD